jgi:GNAT superfamily N-acetyltransferase
MIEIASLTDPDRAAWLGLARGYNDFYESEVSAEDYERAWRRLRSGREIHALGARLDGRLVGIAHFLFHVTIWRAEACYLQDLFVDQAARGQGAARALIEAVAAEARKRGASRFYWQTRHDNARARALYDKVARFRGFIRYDYPIE